MVDPPRLRTVLARLAERRRRLGEYAARELKAYLADEEGVLASKYLFLIAIEDVLAIANHVIASEGYRSPEDYADAFVILGERGVLDRSLAERLMAMARFRNLLVHGSARIEDERVHEYLRKDLEDLDQFSAAVLKFFPDLGRDSTQA